MQLISSYLHLTWELFLYILLQSIKYYNFVTFSVFDVFQLIIYLVTIVRYVIICVFQNKSTPVEF